MRGYYPKSTHHVDCSHLLTEQPLLELVLAALLPKLGQLLIGRLHLLQEALVALLEVFGSLVERKL